MWGASDTTWVTICIACGVSAARLSVSKKLWPYCSCSACGSRMFFNSPPALEWLRRSDPALLARLEAAVARTRAAASAPAAESGGVLTDVAVAGG
jgi:DNA-directed RNA polymerase subunit RPC12/RpoP